MSKRAFFALILILCLLFTSCQIPGLDLNIPGFDFDIPDGENPNDDTDPPSTDINDAPLNESPTDWESASGISYGTLHTTVIKDVPTDITPLLDGELDIVGAVWTSKCDAVATVTGGTVTGVKCGRTDITVTAADGSAQTVTVTVEFLTSSNSGYTFPTAEDKEIYKVSDTRTADRLIDEAIATHKSLIVIDFSGIGNNYNAFEQYHGVLELSSHVSIVKKCYENETHKVYFEITYNEDTASEKLTLTEKNTYSSLANANMIIRSGANAKSERPDDFEDFAINSANSGTMDVYNSEELWWAIQNNLKPVFPLNNSKAELFYERAKMLLRDIITDNMTDFEKVLAIYDCLVNDVAYDYDAADTPTNEGFHTNVCYYLEGVFECGRAVCDGKSKAFVLLCGIEGIGCVRDFGDSLWGGAGHAWNYVELDGKWYLVDTTAADAAYKSSSNFGKFFGAAVEVTMYDLFLAPASSLSDKYRYSGIWSHLTYGDDSYAYSYLTDNVGDTYYNFLINDKAELDALIIALCQLDVCDSCILTFTLADRISENTPFYSADASLPSGADYAIYTMPSGDYTLYFMLIKGI